MLVTRISNPGDRTVPSEGATIPVPAASTTSPAESATLIFDRHGIVLGELTLGGLSVRTGEYSARLFIDNQVESRLVRMCNAGWLPPPAPGQDCIAAVHTAGYRVTTTLDWELTKEATGLLRDAIAPGLPDGCNCNDGAIVTIDPPTGEVLVYVPNTSSRDPSQPGSRPEIDQLVEINTPGTAFMPVTFVAWFDRLGKAPMNTLWDTNPLPIPNAGTIANPRADGGSEGLISARAALAAMQEVPAFRAADEVGTEAVLDMAGRLGITTLAMAFDPTWRDHVSVRYGTTLGVEGVNIRAIDMAYMNATIANMGEMVGTPSLATGLDVNAMRSMSRAEGQDYDDAVRQSWRFQRGDIRLPGTRTLDPIVILEVSDRHGNVLFTQGKPERQRVVNAGSVWLLHTIMADCNARFIVWPCGKANLDLALDFTLSDGRTVPAGVQFGRMPFPPDRSRTLEVWMTGYSRSAATVAWLGNYDNGPVNDGPRYSYASSSAVVRLWKTWMGMYHDDLIARGNTAATKQFEDLRPGNVTFGPFRTTTTDRDVKPAPSDAFSALCEQVVEGWFRTDVQYSSECESIDVDTRDGSRASPATPPAFRALRKFRSLPDLLPASARSLAEVLGIPVVPFRKGEGASHDAGTR